MVAIKEWRLSSPSVPFFLPGFHACLRVDVTRYEIHLPKTFDASRRDRTPDLNGCDCTETKYTECRVRTRKTPTQVDRVTGKLELDIAREQVEDGCALSKDNIHWEGVHRSSPDLRPHRGTQALTKTFTGNTIALEIELRVLSMTVRQRPISCSMPGQRHLIFNGKRIGSGGILLDYMTSRMSQPSIQSFTPA